MFKEFLSRHVFSGFALARQFTLNHHLCGDTRMIHTRLPEYVFAAHPFKANKNVLYGVIDRMTHMQAARDIGRRNHNRISFTRRIHTRLEGAAILPHLIETGLGLRRIEILVQHDLQFNFIHIKTRHPVRGGLVC